MRPDPARPSAINHNFSTLCLCVERLSQQLLPESFEICGLSRRLHETLVLDQLRRREKWRFGVCSLALASRLGVGLSLLTRTMMSAAVNSSNAYKTVIVGGRPDDDIHPHCEQGALNAL